MASSIQLLRSTNTQERPFPNNLLEGQPAVNLNASEPGLFFKAADGSLIKFGPAAITSDGSPPNSSPQGSAGNTIGELWLDKSVDPAVLKVYDGTAWVDAGSGGGGGTASFVRWIYTAAGGETSLSGSSGGVLLKYTPGLEEVYVNGVLITRGTDYSATNGTSITNLVALTAGDVVTVTSINPLETVQLPGQVTLLRWTVLATSGQTVLSGVDSSGQQLAYTPGFEEVYVNGAFLRRGTDYIATDGSTITGFSPLAEDDEITVMAWTPFSVGEEISSSSVNYSRPESGSITRSVSSKLNDLVYSSDFIPPGTNTATVDCSIYLQNALNAAVGKTLVITPGEYRCEGYLEVKGDVVGYNAKLKFYMAVANGPFGSLVYQQTQGSVKGIEIDGSNVSSCVAGIWVNTNYAATRTSEFDLVIKNISNNDPTQACYGAAFIKFSGATYFNDDLDIKANVFNITSTANGIIGDSAGSSRAIVYTTNQVGTNSKVRIHDCIIENVSCGPIFPREDSDGIQVLQGDLGSPSSKGQYNIERCHIKNALKRGIKVQATNCIVSECVVEGTFDECFASLGRYTTFNNCRAISALASCYSLNNVGGRVLNCYGIAPLFAVLRVYPGATDSIIDNCEFVYDSTVPTDKDLRAVVFLNGGQNLMSNCILRNTSGEGAGIKFEEGTLNSNVINTLIKDVEYGLSFVNGAGKIQIDNTEVRASTLGASRRGNSSLDIHISNCVFDVPSGGGLSLESSGGINSARLFLSSSRLNLGGFGVTCAEGSMIQGNEFISSTTSQNGIIIGNDTSAIGNSIRGFNYALQYTSTATAVVMNNVSISATGGLALKTGYTPFAEVNNFAR